MHGGRAAQAASAVLALAIACAASACVRDPDPIAVDPEPIMVNAVLEAGSDSAVVLILGPGGFVTGAEVRLIDRTRRLSAPGDDVPDTTWLAEDRDGEACWDSPARPPNDPGTGRGCYRALLPGAIRSHSEYRLEIELPDGRRIVGTTVVPDRPVLEQPGPGARIILSCGSDTTCFATTGLEGRPRVATTPIAWSLPAHGAVIDVAAASLAIHAGGVVHSGSRCFIDEIPYLHLLHRPPLGIASLSWEIRSVSCGGILTPARFDSIRVRLAVRHLTPEYAAHLDALLSSPTIRARNASVGLEGALGVFTAVASDRADIMLIRNPPPAEDP